MSYFFIGNFVYAVSGKSDISATFYLTGKKLRNSCKKFIFEDLQRAP
jgi:hypothetical protein